MRRLARARLPLGWFQPLQISSAKQTRPRAPSRALSGKHFYAPFVLLHWLRSQISPCYPRAKIITEIPFRPPEQRRLLIPRNQFVFVQARDQLGTDEFTDVYRYKKSRRSASHFHNKHNLFNGAGPVCGRDACWELVFGWQYSCVRWQQRAIDSSAMSSLTFS